MTDQVTGFGAQQEAGQPSETLHVEPGTPDTPQLVTLDLLRQALDEQANRLERRLQSITDKQENRLKKEVDKKVAALESNYQALGLQVPDAARQRVIDDTVLSFLDDGPGAAQPAAPSPELVALVNRQAQEIAEEAGVTLGPGDPEFAQVNQSTPDPNTYLKSWRKAVASKSNRLKGATAPPAAQIQPTQPPSNPAARVPMAGSGAAGGGDLMQQYKQEVAKYPPGSEQVNQIRRKYRNQGLEL